MKYCQLFIYLIIIFFFGGCSSEVNIKASCKDLISLSQITEIVGNEIEPFSELAEINERFVPLKDDNPNGRDDLLMGSVCSVKNPNGYTVLEYSVYTFKKAKFADNEIEATLYTDSKLIKRDIDTINGKKTKIIKEGDKILSYMQIHSDYPFITIGIFPRTALNLETIETLTDVLGKNINLIE